MDIDGIISHQFLQEDVRGKIAPGMRIAVGVGSRSPDQVKIVRIKHTLAMQDILVSESLLPEIEAHPMMEVSGAPREWKFDALGNLVE